MIVILASVEVIVVHQFVCRFVIAVTTLVAILPVVIYHENASQNISSSRLISPHRRSTAKYENLPQTPT